MVVKAIGILAAISLIPRLEIPNRGTRDLPLPLLIPVYGAAVYRRRWYLSVAPVPNALIIIQ